MWSRATFLTLILLTMGLAGCIGDLGEDLQGQSADPSDGQLSTDRGWSMPTEPAQYEVLPGVEASLSSFDDTQISVGIFRPDIDGCDWESQDLPAKCQLPVVMDAGPYWGPSEENRSYRPPLVEWLVPRGYAVVHMSVRGTGESGGCMGFMSMAEQKDVDETITWIAGQAWSNGNVGMMGRSYDGTTPFMGAALGNPHLKTIVPISGVASVPDLMFKNGTSESRGPIMHSVVYWAFYGVGATYGPASVDFRSQHWAEQACPELVEGQSQGAAAFATGDTSATYWQERDFRDRILENYNGSVWVVHGMEDWNVNPSQVVPWISQLEESGIETRAWLGQWAHAYPDRMDEHRNVRWDWAQETLEWFDFYLKGQGEQPPLTVEVEDSQYVWREETTYPPADAQDRTFDVSLGDGMGPATVAGQSSLAWSSQPLEEDLRIAGLPQVQLTATPTTATGGWVMAELYDVFPDGQQVRIGWGVLNLMHHQGGNEDPQTLTPGQAVETAITFEPMDAHVAQGHTLRLVLHKDGVEDIPQSPDPSQVAISDASLHLPEIERPDLTPSYSPPAGVDVTDGGQAR